MPKEQQTVFKRTFSPADVANLPARDPKAQKLYAKKFSKFEKNLRKRWTKDAALREPYILPREADLDEVIRGLEPHPY